MCEIIKVLQESTISSSRGARSSLATPLSARSTARISHSSVHSFSSRKSKKMASEKRTLLPYQTLLTDVHEQKNQLQVSTFKL